MSYLGKSIKKINKLVNFDLKNLYWLYWLYWLTTNKISFSVKETKLVIFKSTRKQFDGEIKLKLNRKRLFPTYSVNYLWLKIYRNLSRNSHIDYMFVKLSRGNALLFKTRSIVNSSLLRTTYFAIYESHLSVICALIWSQNCNSINRIVILQKKLLELLALSQVILTLVLYLKNVLFWNSQIRLILKTLYLSVNQSIIFCFLFLMTVFFLNLTKTMMKLLHIYLLIKSKKFSQIPFLQSIEINYQLIKIFSR